MKESLLSRSLPPSVSLRRSRSRSARLQAGGGECAGSASGDLCEDAGAYEVELLRGGREFQRALVQCTHAGVFAPQALRSLQRDLELSVPRMPLKFETESESSSVQLVVADPEFDGQVG
jgi:hypothetical protein